MKGLVLSFLLPYFVNAISGGIPVKSSEQFPFAVTLTNPILCGGSIISLDPAWILTAAHCIEDFNIEQEVSASVAYGSRNFSETRYAQIKRVVSHPLYIPPAIQLKAQVYDTDKSDQVPYDIALIELTEPLEQSETVNRIRLNMDEENGGSSDSIKNVSDIRLETIGMGYTGVGEPHANNLQYAHCNLSNASPLQNHNFNQSIILVQSNAGLCHGDSGSSLLFRKNKEYTLKGVLNRILNAVDSDPENTSCPVLNNPKAPFVNVFVKPNRHLNWITSVTGLSEAALNSLEPTKNHHFSKSSSVSSTTKYTFNWWLLLFIFPFHLFM